MTDTIYSLRSPVLPLEASPALTQSERQGIHFTFPAERLDGMLATIRAWFQDCDEVILVGYGTTHKEALGFILLEWDECEIHPLFLAILRDEESIEDMSIYLAH